MRTHHDLQSEIQEVTRATGRNMSRYREITSLYRESSLLAHSQPRNCCLDYENFIVIIQIFTGCKWELICTLQTLIGKQIEKKLHCQLSPGREHWQDGRTDNQRINTRDKIQRTHSPGDSPGSLGAMIDSTDICSVDICSPSIVVHFRLLSIEKTCKNFIYIARFFAQMQIFTDLSPHFHVWSCLFRCVCLDS